MRLADFISSNIEPILMEWEVFARSIAPGKMDVLALRDHARSILLATVRDMNSPQSAAERSAKSKGHRAGVAGGSGAALDGASVLHGVGRLGSGFDLMEVVSEYRALRASVLELWHKSDPAPDDRDVSDVTRFNESIDQSLSIAVASYTQRVDQSRDLFMAILGHDLRNPLNSIAMSAAALPAAPDNSETEQREVAAQIKAAVAVMSRMVHDLLDFTRTRLGAGMPVNPHPMDAGELCRALYDEFRTAHPRRDIRYEATGASTGEWDADRLRQAVSNLLGNAVQHGAASAPIQLQVNGQEPSEVRIVVRSGGAPIPPDDLPRIFEPLIRGASAQEPKQNLTGSIGLGLYIAREVARSHSGRIEVTSGEADGTAFTLRLPRNGAARAARPTRDEQHVQTT